MQNFDAECARIQDLGSAELVELQEAGPFVSCNRVIGLRGLNQIEQIAVGGVGSMMRARD